MARIASSQPNEAMVRVASRKNITISLDPKSIRLLISLSAFNFRVEKDWAITGVTCHHHHYHQSPPERSHNFAFSPAGISPTPL